MQHELGRDEKGVLDSISIKPRLYIYLIVKSL